jgi:hypothetical protein
MHSLLARRSEWPTDRGYAGKRGVCRFAMVKDRLKEKLQ